ncbi:MAG: class II fructose-bisphosphate aldolase [Anaerolineaceae bacterium]|nr:class II fructose-bisphosphate aldolase [Anaerolineaceae bacterium]
MKALESVEALLNHVADGVQVDGSQVTVTDEAALKVKVDDLVYTAVFTEGLVRDTARWLLWELGQALGIYPASIHELYMAIGRGDVPHNFTVPAINVRGMNYNTARAIFRAAQKYDAGAILLEIARSEIGYTGQRPYEYVTSLIGAAIKEGFRGPLFVQGDHFQVSAKGYQADPDKELQAVKDLMKEAIAAGFYNIDIDTSTLVDLSFPSLDEQQRLNYTLCAELTRYARELEPKDITVSLGGEIGEVGHKNSTVEELHAFMQGYRRALNGLEGISKISVQTGTSHGGVVLPDGTLAQVKVDFETLRALSAAARDEYGLGGAVQHGASTLPANAFNKFPEVGTVEIHLATGFQNIIYDQAPKEMVNAAYDYVRANFKQKADQTEDQFLYQERKRAFGPLKQQWWDVPAEAQEKLGQVLQEQFEFLFDQLNIQGTRAIVAETVMVPKHHRVRPKQAVEEGELEIAPDLAD